MTYEKSLTTVRSTGLGHLARSPAHFKAWVEEPEVIKPAFEFGKAFHCYLLEPENFDARYIVRPAFGDLRYKDNKTEYLVWKDEAGERSEVTAEDMATIQGMVNAISRHAIAKRLVRGGFAEQRIAVPRGSLEQIASPDYILPNKGIVVDPKSCDAAGARDVERSISNYGYLMQATHYLSVLSEYGLDVRSFVFLFVEKSAPYGIFVGDLDPEDLAWAEDRRQQLMDIQERCVQEGKWPGYDEHIQRIKLPVWART